MIIYVNSYLHKLYYSSYVTESHRQSLSDSIIIILFALNLLAPGFGDGFSIKKKKRKKTPIKYRVI